MSQHWRFFFINFTYWFGVVADSIWTIGLFFPQVFGILTGNTDFSPEIQLRGIMGVAGTLMAGWTILLLWGLRKPIERRFILLLTAFPVVFGLFVVSLLQVLGGNTFETWILIKCVILFISMIYSYFLASKVARAEE